MFSLMIIRPSIQITKNRITATTTAEGRWNLFRLLSANLQFNFCLALIPILPYFKSTEVTKLSEHCSSNNIRRWIWFICWLRFWYMFASIILLCFIYSNLLLHCNYYCITMFSSCVSNIYKGKNIIRTQQQRQH